VPERSQYQFDKEAQRRVARDLLDQKAASSRPGQVYHTMTSLQDRMGRPGYQNNKADINQLKGLRRDWNRNQKYTPQGMRVSGATSPLDAQKRFSDTTETFRQGNPKAYRQMYPISGGIMHLGEQGGFLGAILSEIGKMGRDKGIPTVVDDSVEEQERYVTDTFGPHREDIEELDITDEYQGPWPHEDMPIFPDIYRGPRPHEGLPSLDVYEGPRPHEGLPLLPVEAGQPPLGAVDVTGEPTRKRDVGYDITASDLNVEPMPPADYGDLEYFDWVDKYYDTHNPDGTPKADPTVIPGGGTSYVDRFAPIDEEEIVEEVIPPVPFDDSVREAGIAALYGQGPQWGGTNRRYEDEYRDYVERSGDMPGGPMTYEEFSEAWEGIHQGRPHAGLR